LIDCYYYCAAHEYAISIEPWFTWYVILYPTETEDECIIINVGIKTMQKVNALLSPGVPLNGLCNLSGQTLMDFFIHRSRHALEIVTLQEAPVSNAERTETVKSLAG
jgi:hypothetical protein